MKRQIQEDVASCRLQVAGKLQVASYKLQVADPYLKRARFSEPATCNLEPATCNLEPATCNLEPATCNLEPATRNSEPAPCKHAFTLIELLIVISIMAILAGMIIPISGAVSRNRIKAKARTELEQVATGIELYKAKLGHYPPDNPRNPSINQLYFELLGSTATNINNKQAYITLDGSGRVYASTLQALFSAAGIINSTAGTGGDEARSASSFLRGLKPGQYTAITNPPVDTTSEVVRLLSPTVAGAVTVLNTFNYVSSNPTNNPNSYDLWVDIPISGKTNRICNWSQQTIILP